MSSSLEEEKEEVGSGDEGDLLSDWAAVAAASQSFGNTNNPPPPAGERPPSTIAESQPEPQQQQQQQQQPVRRAPGRRFTVVPMERSDGTPNVTSPYLANRDEDILKRTIQDCGLHAYGAIFLEVWVLSSDGKYLRRPIGGHWMDPQFIHSFSSPELPQQVENFAPDCAPGVSLAGTLYNETSQWGHWGINRQVYWRQIKSMAEDPFIQDDGRMKRIYEDLGIGFVATVPFYYQGRNGIVLFMNRTSCNVDNLRSTANENFLIAAADLIGAAFAIRIPRQELSDIRRDMFQSAVNKVMLLLRTQKGRQKGSIIHHMTTVLGANPTDSFALDMFRRCSDNADAAESQTGKDESSKSFHIPDSWHHPADTAAVYARIGWNTLSTITRRVATRVVNSVRKWEGAGMKGPARFSLPDCAIIFVMVTCAMLAILRMNLEMENLTGDAHAETNDYEWDLNGGWYASTMCIVFALSSAPVGQPRQIVGAHIINALVGLAFQQIPTYEGIWTFSDFAAARGGNRAGLPLFWKESFAVGTGVAIQGFLGIMHPPATGLAFSFASSSRYQLSNLVIVILADVMLIIIATGFLNLQAKKQYPMFWFGFSWKYPAGKTYEFMNKTRDTAAVLVSERIVKKKCDEGKSEKKFDSMKGDPQDRTTSTSTTSVVARSNGTERPADEANV